MGYLFLNFLLVFFVLSFTPWPLQFPPFFSFLHPLSSYLVSIQTCSFLTFLVTSTFYNFNLTLSSPHRFSFIPMSPFAINQTQVNNNSIFSLARLIPLHCGNHTTSKNLGGRWNFNQFFMPKWISLIMRGCRGIARTVCVAFYRSHLIYILHSTVVLKKVQLVTLITFLETSSFVDIKQFFFSRALILSRDHRRHTMLCQRHVSTNVFDPLFVSHNKFNKFLISILLLFALPLFQYVASKIH